jgi:hypothetical protein
MIGECRHRFYEHLPRHTADHLDHSSAIEAEANGVAQGGGCDCQRIDRPK